MVFVVIKTKLHKMKTKLSTSWKRSVKKRFVFITSPFEQKV